MRQRFLAGAAGAGLLVATTFNLGMLEGGVPTRDLSGYALEIQEGYQLGLLAPDAFSRSRLDRPVTREAYAEALRKVFAALGLPIGDQREAFDAAGIFQRNPRFRGFTRGEAIESLCRALLYLADQGRLRLDPPSEGAAAATFSDFVVAGPYATPFQFLIDKGIVKGYPDSRLKAANRLTHRETVYLLYRLQRYGLTGVSAPPPRPTPDLTFLDLPADPFMLASIQAIARAGGARQSTFGARFQGHDALRVSQMTEIVTGICRQARLNLPPAAWDSASRPRRGRTEVSRGQLAEALGLLVGAARADLSPTRETTPGWWPYCDVDERASEVGGLVLLHRIGVQLGYSGGRLVGREPVTRFEAIGVIAAVIDRLGLDPGRALTVSAAAPLGAGAAAATAGDGATPPGTAATPTEPATAEGSDVNNRGATANAADPALSDPPPPAHRTIPAADESGETPIPPASDERFANFVAEIRLKQARIRALIERRRTLAPADPPTIGATRE